MWNPPHHTDLVSYINTNTASDLDILLTIITSSLLPSGCFQASGAIPDIIN